MNRKSAIIVDLDGTLANCDHRVHYLRQSPKDWKGFFEGLIDDDLNLWCDELIRAMKLAGHHIILMTGRSVEYIDLTQQWLSRHKIEYDELLMRASSDFRSDNVVKRELYEVAVKCNYQTIFVVEDRMSVVAMWRELGLTCLQCDLGDF